jgi:hypothetical protein
MYTMPFASGPHRTRQGRPRPYFRGRTAAQSSYPSFLFLYRLLYAATGWPSRGWYRDGRKSWRERGNLSHHATGLSHGSVLLLESLTETLRALDELVDAAHGATLFLG